MYRMIKVTTIQNKMIAKVYRRDYNCAYKHNVYTNITPSSIKRLNRLYNLYRDICWTDITDNFLYVTLCVKDNRLLDGMNIPVLR